MKKIILSVLFILTMFIADYAKSATTSDGAITLNFYEDTQSSIESRWILDFTVNGLGSLHIGNFEELTFSFQIYNGAMLYENVYNDIDTDYYNISGDIISTPYIRTDFDDLPTLAGTEYTFYAMPREEGEPVIGNFTVNLYYTKNIGSQMHEQLTLTGPVGFSAVPEPMSMLLFVFGAFFLRFITN